MVRAAIKKRCGKKRRRRRTITQRIKFVPRPKVEGVPCSGPPPVVVNHNHTFSVLPDSLLFPGEYSYLLFSDTGGPNKKTQHHRTYIGFTNNPKRRIRQHNCEIVGGAKYTSGSEYRWRFAAIVGGFSSRSQALSFEWHWKRARSGPLNRMAMLKKILGNQKIVGEQSLWVSVSDRWIDFAFTEYLKVHEERVPVFQLQI